MMTVAQSRLNAARRNKQGFTLTEMLVTLLIMTLASTLLATGIPVAIDTYQKTVKSANAQIALSTTLTVLRAELGSSSDVRVVGDKIYYLSDEGYWASISNPTTYRGLEKQYYGGQPSTDAIDSVEGLGAPIDDMCYPLISDSIVTDQLNVRFVVDSREARTDPILIEEVVAEDEATPPNELASVNEYRVLLRFDS